MKFSTINALTFLGLFFVSSELFAQPNFGASSDSEQRLLIGATAGVNFSTFKFTGDFNNYYPNTKAVFGLNGGLNIGIEFNKLAFLTGLHFIQRGSKYSTDNINFQNGDVGFEELNTQNNYLNIPLLLRYRTGGDDGLGFTINAGPTFNIGINGNTDYLFTSRNGAEELISYESDFGAGINDDYRKAQMSFMLSPGVIVPIGEKGRVGFNIVFDFSLSNIINERAQDAAGISGAQKNRSTMFTISYEHCLEFGGTRY